MSQHFIRTAADEERLVMVWRKVIDGQKYLVAHNVRSREICRVFVPGKPLWDWRSEANGKERRLVVRWIIENLPRPWNYL